MSNQIHNPQKAREVQAPAAPIMIKGLAADFHVEHNKAKRQRCPFDVGFDLFPGHTEPDMCQMENAVLFKVDTFISVCFGVGHFGFLTSRSSTNVKLEGGSITSGVFDPGYTGPVYINILCQLHAWEKTLEAIKTCQKEKVALAQMVVLPYYIPVFAVWDDRNVLPGRGANGFGHSDVFLK